MKSWNHETRKSGNHEYIHVSSNIDHNLNSSRSQQWGPRTIWTPVPSRTKNPDTHWRDVFVSPVASVQGQSPSERSESIREVPNFSSENFPSNVLFEKLFSSWRRRTTVFNLPPSWQCRRRPKHFWFVCLNNVITSRFMVNVWLFNRRTSNYGNVYLILIKYIFWNQSHFLSR